jgi:hypothetical protein
MGGHVALVALAFAAVAPLAAPAPAGNVTGHQLFVPTLVARVADLDRPVAKRRAHHRRHVYREWYTPGQHWQPWPAGRHHLYWHGGVTSAFCYGIHSAPEATCYERDW